MKLSTWIADHIPSSQIEHEDRVNNRFLGNARIDALNNVDTRVMSKQVGTTEAPLSTERRQELQQGLLDKRLENYLTALHTPSFVQQRTTMKTVGPYDVPYMKVPVPRMLDVHISSSRRSFNEHAATRKLEEAFFSADPEVRNQFLQKIKSTHTRMGQSPKIRSGFKTLLKTLEDPEQLNKRAADLATLDQEVTAVEEQRALKSSERSRRLYKIPGIGSALLKKKEERLNNAIVANVSPSSYDSFLTQTALEPSSRPLYVNDYIAQSKNAKTFRSPALPAAFGSSAARQNHARDAFHKLADAIRTFQHSPAGEERNAALYQAMLPILNSKESKTVRRCISDMVRQLKKAGVPAAELQPLYELMPQDVNYGLKAWQSVQRGLGKGIQQMDAAQRTATAMPVLLELIERSGKQQELKENLMYFNIEGADTLKNALNGVNQLPPDDSSTLSGSEGTGEKLHNFMQTASGKAFKKAIVQDLETYFEKDSPAITDLKHEAKKGTSESFVGVLQHVLMLVNQEAGPLDEFTSKFVDRLVQNNQHLFMQTTDEAFWDSESIDKMMTRLAPGENGGGDQKTRIFKQMTLRAAMMGMEQEEVDGFMAQGIRNRLNSRSMMIEGSKIGGVAGAAVGNILAKVLTVPLIKINPVLAVPGLSDVLLMPVTWAIGAPVGAAVIGAPLGVLKKKRLAETEALASETGVNAVPFERSTATPDTYLSRGILPSVRYDADAWRTWDYRNKAEPFRSPVTPDRTKQAASTVYETPGRQLASAHGKVWGNIIGEASYATGKSLKVGLYSTPKAIWKDTIVHGGRLSFPRRERRNEDVTAAPLDA